jgi:hypothetical protein
MAFDDPIVFPGQPGASHLHMFFGNSLANGNSTATSIASTGNSTCRGGTINRTAYWVPAMIDTKDGTPIAASDSSFYYKTAYAGLAPSSIKAFPPGMRIIAGDSKATGPGGPFDYNCNDAGGNEVLKGSTILSCPANTWLIMTVMFPQCWDGVNLDSPDHKSHMAYPTGGKCPSTHPVGVPEITFRISFPVKEANAPARWRLASDNYDRSLPGGYSAHGDWFNGWKPDFMSVWMSKCLNASADCHSHLLGDGRMMTGVGVF